MMVHFEFYRDEEGLPRVRAPKGHELAATFLETDMQGDTALADEILEGVASIAGREADRGVFVGNAHVVEVRPDEVCIESEFDEDADIYRMPTEAFTHLLKRWRRFID